MNKASLTNWLEKLKLAWESTNPSLSVELVADNFIWYEAPFQNPISSKEALLKTWEEVLDHKDVLLTYKIVCLNDNFAFVHWNSSHSQISTSTTIEMDGIYQINLDDDGLCTEFHQWFNVKSNK